MRLATVIMPRTDIATRAYIVAPKASPLNKPSAEVEALTSVAARTVSSIYTRAIERGFDPNAVPIKMRDAYVEDAPRSGRPSKQNEETTTAVMQARLSDGSEREKRAPQMSQLLKEKASMSQRRLCEES